MGAGAVGTGVTCPRGHVGAGYVNTPRALRPRIERGIVVQADIKRPQRAPCQKWGAGTGKAETSGYNTRPSRSYRTLRRSARPGGGCPPAVGLDSLPNLTAGLTAPVRGRLLGRAAAQRLACRAWRTAPAAPRPATYRAPIRTFTPRARVGLLKSFARVDRRGLAPPLFVTLTYPATYSADGRRWKRDLDALGKRLRRKYPSIAVQWRLEAQKRGAPHYHLLVYHVAFIPAAWLARQWYEVVASGDARHLRHGTRVEALRSWAGAQSYVSKYLAKAAGDAPEFAPGTHPGRFWGSSAGRTCRPLPTRSNLTAPSSTRFGAF